MANGIPYILSEAVVGAYEGANPAPNPLDGLKITRRFELSENGLNIIHRFKNASKEPMNFSYRIGNYPAAGKRFNAKNIVLSAGKTELDATAPENVLLLKKVAAKSFIKNVRKYSWDGARIVLSARDGNLRDSIILVPRTDFPGIYSWTLKASIPRKTIEFLFGPATLQAGAETTAEYAIEFGQ